jgi:hypothetical protein
MSVTGNFTSLEFNVLSALTQNQGLTINSRASSYQGTWNNGTYSAGSVTNNTVLKKLTDSLPLFYGNLNVNTWRSLISIGNGICPALGNSKPATFVPTYAGYGTWQYVTKDDFNNVTGTGPLTMTSEVYPPRNYGIEKTYSYIFQEKNDYAYLTGWPGRNSWQKTTDDFAAAYPPRPSDTTYIDYDLYFKNGFIATVAQQAYYEFWYNYASRRPNQYAEFLLSIQTCADFMSNQNRTIASLYNNLTFLRGNYSNINDLTTSDISGVNLAFRDFGNDLIRLGKAINLNDIHVFGLPSKLLLNLQAKNALTEALRFSLLYNELSTTELNLILSGAYVPTVEQEKKIYDSFGIVRGSDLNEIKIIINCSTDGLTSLADLLNPLKMFPNSYASLTVPEYTIADPSYKIYKLIYSGNNVNPDIANNGQYLSGILPPDQAKACGAFMYTMNQIKNIRMIDFERFSQVIANLEVTNQNLPLINSSQSTPGNTDLTNTALELTAFGTATGGTYNFCDFFGAMSGVPYNLWYSRVQALLNEISTATLTSIYNQLYTLATTAPGDNSQASALIAAANSEIANIAAANPSAVNTLNYYWSKIGTQLSTEHAATALAVQQTINIYQTSNVSNLETFVKKLSDYALKTGQFDIATVIENISDTTTIGGQSIVAVMRESRNAKRINNMGGELDSDLPTTLTPGLASARATVTNGQITSVQVTSGGTGYGDPVDTTISPNDYVPQQEQTIACECCEPDAIISPQGGVFGGSGNGASIETVLDDFGSVREIIVTNSGAGYNDSYPPPVYVANPPIPIRLGRSTVPGSFAGSPYTGQTPVSDNLLSAPNSSYTVSQAIQSINQ